jgi:hypothetical protein
VSFAASPPASFCRSRKAIITVVDATLPQGDPVSRSVSNALFSEGVEDEREKFVLQRGASDGQNRNGPLAHQTL